MKELNDMDHFVLQPGEMLILRARVHLSMEQLKRMQQMFDSDTKLPMPVLVIPSPDFDIMAGVPDPMVFADNGDDLDHEYAEQEHRLAVTEAYEAGKIIEFRPKGDDSWISAHKHASPHRFDWQVYEYKEPK